MRRINFADMMAHPQIIIFHSVSVDQYQYGRWMVSGDNVVDDGVVIDGVTGHQGGLEDCDIHTYC